MNERRSSVFLSLHLQGGRSKCSNATATSVDVLYLVCGFIFDDGMHCTLSYHGHQTYLLSFALVAQ